MTADSTSGTTGSELLVRRFGEDGTPVLLVHGLGEQGDIFCPAPEAGLAPWLKQAGYCAHVADLRMRHSAAASATNITQYQLITEDVPALFERIAQEHPQQRFFIVSHGWGGVLVACALIRHPEWLPHVAGLVQIGVRRVCHQHGWQRRVLMDLMWGRVAPLLGRRQGILALRSLGLGRVDISRQLHDEVRMWQNGGNWRDPQDCFDYAAALTNIRWPDSLYLAGSRDHTMGHVADVRSFAHELGVHDAQLILMQKGSGSSRSYGHRDLLTHPQAVIDLFPLVLSWMSDRQHPIPEQTEYKEA